MQQALCIQFFLGALVSLLVITNPLSKIPLFISLTGSMDAAQKREQARRAAVFSFLVMAVSLAAGNLLLSFFGISYGAMRIAGGLVVAVIGQQMLFGGNSPNKAPAVDKGRDDYAFFPLAMPGIAGPGTIAVVIGFSTQIAEVKGLAGEASMFGAAMAAIAVTSFAVWCVMRSSDYCAKALGPSGTQVLSKLMGFLLVCIGVQFVGSGIRTFLAGG